MTTTRLEASALTLGYADTDVVRDLDLRIPHGKVTVVVGANACGKSTLLRGLARLLKPRSGSVLLDGEAIHRLPTKQVARTLGLLPQNPIAPEGVTVASIMLASGNSRRRALAAVGAQRAVAAPRRAHPHHRLGHDRPRGLLPRRRARARREPRGRDHPARVRRHAGRAPLL